jgi:poly [ADP-ribose] polymerase
MAENIADDDMIEAAKSGRASCRVCKKKIEKGDLRFGEAYDSGFGDGPSYGWHHLECAAKRHAVRLEGAIERYDGDIDDLDDLKKAIDDGKKNAAKAERQFPYAEHAPSGRSTCLECDKKIPKDELRVAIEREIDTGAFTRKGAGYLHAACAFAHIGEEDLLDQVLANSVDLSDDDKDDLETVLG